MSEGNALLLALVRRKGSPHALADWLIEHMPAEVRPPGVVACSCESRTLVASVKWFVRDEFGAWLTLTLQWGPVVNGLRQSGLHDVRQCVHFTHSTAGHWLPKYLSDVFIRRKSRKKTAA